MSIYTGIPRRARVVNKFVNKPNLLGKIVTIEKAKDTELFILSLDGIPLASCRYAEILARYGFQNGAEQVKHLPKADWSVREDDL